MQGQFSFLLQTLDIDYLALVDPVDIKTFRIHLHGDRNRLCGVLDGDEGVHVHTFRTFIEFKRLKLLN